MPLFSQITAFLTAAALAFPPFALTPCACGAPFGASCCQLRPAEPSCCCDAGCASATGCCCGSAATPNESGPCSRSTSSNDAPAVPGSPVRVVDVEGGSLLLPATLVAAHAGLHGSPWATAFDLEAHGSLPGLRLHALFCVWRN